MKTLFGFACVALMHVSSAVAQPVLRYSFDEASGNAVDSGQAPLTAATLEGGATRSSDTPSGAGMSLDMRTDGPYAHLLGADDADLDNLTALTLTTWLKVEGYPTNVSNNKRLVSKQAAGAFGGFNFSMNAVPNDGDVGADNFKIGLFLGNNLSSSPTDFGFIFADVDVDAANKWVMLAVTYDSSLAEANTKFYIGDAATGVTQLGSDQTLVQLTVDGGDAPVGVGYTHAAPTADTSVTGWQDDVRVYNTALDLAALDAVRLENVGGGGGFAGDFTENGTVDAADLAAWQTGFGASGAALHTQGDADADMDVDGADFLVWQKEFGSTGGGIASVPEPATGVLLALAVLSCCVMVRRVC
jgi:hypothetical protein